MAAVTFDSVGAGFGLGGATAVAGSYSHTITGNALVGIVFSTSTTNPNVVTMTCGATSMPIIGSTLMYLNNSGIFYQLTMFGLLVPPTGAQTVSIVNTGPGSTWYNISANSVSYNNVGSFGTLQTVTSGASTTLSQPSIASAVNHMVVQAFAKNTTNVVTAPTQTIRWNVAGPTGGGVVGSCVPIQDADGAATVSFGCTDSSNPAWGGVAVDLIPAVDIVYRSLTRIPNRNVGPMALRRNFRQVLRQSFPDPPSPVTVTPTPALLTLTGSAPADSPVTRDPATGNLMHNGRRYRFSGVNAFNDTGLVSTTNGNAYGGVDVSGNYLVTHSQIDALLTSAQALNVSVIRCYSAVASGGVSNSLQPTLGSFNSAALENVDYLLQQCALKDMKVVFPLTDNYNNSGISGKYWYLSANAITPDGDATQFFTNSTVITQFKAQISYVLSHVNQYTGVTYKNDPTVLAWETGNELTASGLSAASYTSWLDTISQYIKVTLGAVQLVMDGTYGITGDLVTYRTADLALTYVDIYSDHTYDNFRQPQWVAKEAEVAHANGKAFYIGEYTWTDKDASAVQLTWFFTEMLSRIEGDTNIDGDAIFDLLAPLTSWGGGLSLHSPGDDANMTSRGSQLAAHCTAMSLADPQTITIEDQIAGSTTSNTVSLTFDADKWTPRAGDIVAIWVAVNGSTGISVPAGWVNPLGGNTVVSYASSTYWMAYHIVTSGEATAGTLTYAMSSVMGSLGFSEAGVVLRGVDNANIVDAAASGFNSSAGVTHVLPGVSGLLDGSLIFSGVAKQGTGTYTQLDGWGRATWLETTQTQWVMQLDTRGTAGGSTSNANITSANSVPYAAISVAFSAVQAVEVTPTNAALTLTGGTPTIVLPQKITPTGASLTLTGSASRLDLTLRPTAGSLTLTGSTPTIVLPQTFTPAAAALTLAGSAPRLDLTLRPTTGSLTVGGATPIIVNPQSAIPTAASLTVTGSAPAVVLGVRVTPTAASLTIAGSAPVIVNPQTFVPGGAALSLTGGTPSVVVGVYVAPTAAVLTLTGAAPTVVVPFTPTAATLTLTGSAPRLDLTLRPTSASLTVSGATPVVVNPQSATPSGAALALTGSAPAVVVGVTVTPTAATLTVTGSAPVIVNPQTFVPSGAALNLTGGTPSVVVGVTAAPGAAALTLTGSAPRLDLTLRPTAASLTLTGATPQLTGPQSVTPTAAALTVTGAAPTVVTPQTFTPAAATLTLTGSAPALDTTLRPAAASLTVTGAAPRLDLTVRPTAASLTLTGATPGLTGPQSVTPAAAALTLTGSTPNVLTPQTVQPSAATLTLTGATPQLTGPQAVTPTAASLTVTGSAPVIVTPQTFRPSAAALTLAGSAPQLDLTLRPATVTVALTGGTPVVTLPIQLTPTPAVVTLSGAAPTVELPQQVRPTASGLVLAGSTPTVLLSIIATPGAAGLTLITAAPTLLTPQTFAPGTALLTLTASAPIVNSTTSDPVFVPQAGQLTLAGAAPTVLATGDIRTSVVAGVERVTYPPDTATDRTSVARFDSRIT